MASVQSSARPKNARKSAEGDAASFTGSNIAEFTREQELEAYKMMLLIRRFEEKAGQMYGMGLIGGFCHLYIGQEAVVSGVQLASKEGDAVITGYRDHGHMLALGMARCTCSPRRSISTAATASSLRRFRWARDWRSRIATAAMTAYR
jgi:pyruvate dehydrogenase E1 component alpha subunit